MKNLIAAIAVLMFVGQAKAGSYNYECSALRVSSQGEVQKLIFNRDGGTINELGFSNNTVNENLDGDLEFLLKKRTVAAKVTMKSVIRNFNENVGAREHSIYAFVADIKITDGKKVIKYTGTCVEETMSTCGGDCGGGDQ